MGNSRSGFDCRTASGEPTASENNGKFMHIPGAVSTTALRLPYACIASGWIERTIISDDFTST